MPKLPSIFILTTLLFSSVFCDCGDYYCDNANTTSSLYDWMSQYPDSVFLSDLTIPGTYDSVGYVEGKNLQTDQVWNIEVQLEAGIRFFDVRLGWHSAVVASQGLYALPGPISVQDILDTFVEFLQTYPSETVILSISMENYPTNLNLWLNGMNSVFTDPNYANYWYQPIDSGIPTLGNSRGKIVLVNGVGLTNQEMGLNFPNGTNGLLVNDIFDVEDHNSDIDPLQKSQLVLAHLNLAQNENVDNHLWQVTVLYATPLSGCISNSSCVTEGDYQGLAKILNQQLYQFLEVNPLSTFGIIALDFPGQALINSIVETNLEYIYNEIPGRSKYEAPAVPRWVVGIICGIVGVIVLFIVFFLIYKDSEEDKDEDNAYSELQEQ